MTDDKLLDLLSTSTRICTELGSFLQMILGHFSRPDRQHPGVLCVDAAR